MIWKLSFGNITAFILGRLKNEVYHHAMLNVKFLDFLKQANVTQCHKKENPKDKSNFLPVSVPPHYWSTQWVHG